MTAEKLTQWLQPPAAFAIPGADTPVAIPLLAARVRALREVGTELRRSFHGSAAELVTSAGNSAAALVRLITAHFPAFRDHTTYGGEQVFLYKRAQIFVGDVWGAFQGKLFGTFDDIDRLTCFADYRIPQLLRHLGVLVYSAPLAAAVDGKQEIVAGSVAELSIRAATVQAVERMNDLLPQRLMACQLDWILWETGEAALASLPPHHRTRTIYY
jgi:hypothetical protein